MTTTNLEREMAAAITSLKDRHVDELRAVGVDGDDIDLGLVGVAHGRVQGDLFEPDGNGKLAYVTPVRTHHALTFETSVPDSALRVGDIIDLVFWHPLYPRDWAVRTGVAEVLGLISPQYCHPEPVEVWRGPLGWLRAGCRGLVLLSHDPVDVYRVLSQCRRIVAEDEAHARSLIRALERPWPRPSVTFRRPARVRHVA